MRILHLSDTHGFHNSFPKRRFENIDVILHSGDCSNSLDVRSNEPEVRDFLEWYSSVPVKHKIFVAGNHDTSIERKKVTPGDFSKNGIIYLQNSSTTIEDIKFWGSPITPTFGNWSFMKAREKTHEVWKLIPGDTDVLILHGPPKGVRDLSFNRNGELELCGCSALMKKCRELENTLKAVCFGHIHNMEGVYNKGTSKFNENGTIFSNAACVEDGKFYKGLTSFGNVIEIKKTINHPSENATKDTQMPSETIKAREFYNVAFSRWCLELSHTKNVEIAKDICEWVCDRFIERGFLYSEKDYWISVKEEVRKIRH